jgi:hypothetical protein
MPVADDGATHATSTTDQATTASPIADDGATHKTSTTDQAAPGSPPTILQETSNGDSSTLSSEAAGGG